MKKALSLIVVAIMLVAAVLPMTAMAEDELLVDLRPQKSFKSDMMKVNGAELSYEKDGTVVVTLTQTYATIEITLVDKGVVNYGDEIDVSKPAFVVVDYASADGVTFGTAAKPLAHYTRKDKDATGDVADLYLGSMESSDYANYAAKKGDGYVAWDWGTYVGSSDSKVFDNKLHRFTSIEYEFTGSVGMKMYIYKFGVYNTAELEGLGKTRPEPTVIEESSEEPVESSEEPVESSEEPVESSEEPTESSEAVTESSEVATSETESADESVVEQTSDSESSETAESTAESKDDEGGLGVGGIIGIIVAVLAVAGVAAYFIVKSKKK